MKSTDSHNVYNEKADNVVEGMVDAFNELLQSLSTPDAIWETNSDKEREIDEGT